MEDLPRSFTERIAEAGLVLARDRDQLWAEATHRYTAGEPWHLTGAADEAQRADTAQYVHGDPWVDTLEEWLVGNPGPVTTAQAMAALGIPVERRTRSDEMRVGKILEGTGRFGARRVVDGVRATWWSRS